MLPSRLENPDLEIKARVSCYTSTLMIFLTPCTGCNSSTSRPSTSLGETMDIEKAECVVKDLRFGILRF
jgi:hypothetical protein